MEDLTKSFMSSTPPMSSFFMSSTPPMSSSFMSSTLPVIESSTEPGTPSATPSPTMGPQKQFQCWKCQVANCSSCPEDQFNTSCTECMEGFELISLNSTSRKDRCVPDGAGGDGGGDTTPLVDTGDGGGGGSSSLNKGAVAGGVVAGGVAVLVVAAVIIVLLWRRRKATSGKEVVSPYKLVVESFLFFFNLPLGFTPPLKNIIAVCIHFFVCAGRCCGKFRLCNISSELVSLS